MFRVMTVVIKAMAPMDCQDRQLLQKFPSVSSHMTVITLGRGSAVITLDIYARRANVEWYIVIYVNEMVMSGAT